MNNNPVQSQDTSEQVQPQNTVENEIYMQVWEKDLEFMKTRWTVTTFFMSVSFGIFAFSFQNTFSPSTSLAIRITALFIYWFSYVMYLHLYEITKSLRAYLKEMETSGRTTIHIQSKVWYNTSNPKKFSSLYTYIFLLTFGLIYTAGAILLQLLRL